MKSYVRVFKNREDITFNKKEGNIFFVTGLSGSGKSYYSKMLAKELDAKIFQVEWLIHYKHCDEEFKKFLDDFIEKYDINEYVLNKWNNVKKEDDNELLKKYINLLLKEFIDIYKDGVYIIEGLQLFTLIDVCLIKNYFILIKGTGSITSLKNRVKRDYQKRKDYKFIDKVKWFIKVIKQSSLYQFKHRRKLNDFIGELTKIKDAKSLEI